MADMYTYNPADWMGSLPSDLCKKPLTNLAIPGTHDSGAYDLHKNCPVAPDAPDVVQTLSCLPFVKQITANWGVTQALDVKGQLEAGVRYLDLRVACNPDNKELYLVHTLYGPKVDDMLAAVSDFLNQHPKEVVLLDFNHFYNMDTPDHQSLLQQLLSTFGSKLCGKDFAVASVSIEQMLASKKQVVVFYQTDIHDQPERTQVVTSASICSPWPNTPDPEQCLEYLKKTFSHRPHKDFVVCQGVVTPSNSTVFWNLCGSLHKLNQTLSPLLVPWLSSTSDRLDIVIADFVNEADFIKSVLDRNFNERNHR